MPLTAEQRADLEAKLAEARETMHRLQLGQAELSVSAPGGRSYALQAAKVDELRMYIAGLECQLGQRRRVVGRPYFR